MRKSRISTLLFVAVSLMLSAFLPAAVAAEPPTRTEVALVAPADVTAPAATLADTPYTLAYRERFKRPYGAAVLAGVPDASYPADMRAQARQDVSEGGVDRPPSTD